MQSLAPQSTLRIRRAVARWAFVPSPRYRSSVATLDARTRISVPWKLFFSVTILPDCIFSSTSPSLAATCPNRMHAPCHRCVHRNSRQTSVCRSASTSRHCRIEIAELETPCRTERRGRWECQPWAGARMDDVGFSIGWRDFTARPSQWLTEWRRSRGAPRRPCAEDARRGRHQRAPIGRIEESVCHCWEGRLLGKNGHCAVCSRR